MTFDGRIDLNALQSPTALEKFDYDSMNISELEIEAELDVSIVTECWDRTPMHVAVAEKKDKVIRCFIEYKGSFQFFYGCVWRSFCLNCPNLYCHYVFWRQSLEKQKFSCSALLL